MNLAYADAYRYVLCHWLGCGFVFSLKVFLKYGMAGASTIGMAMASLAGVTPLESNVMPLAAQTPAAAPDLTGEDPLVDGTESEGESTESEGPEEGPQSGQEPESAEDGEALETLENSPPGEDGDVEPQVASIMQVAFPAALPLTAGVSRAGGADRYGTAVAISQRLFPVAGGADVVFVASGDSYPDGLTLGALASSRGGPLLMVKRGGVPPSVVAEIRRLSPTEIVVAGGEGAVSQASYSTLQSLAPKVRRLQGADRYATAAAIAAEFPLGSGAMLATGTDFPDALVASAVSAKNGGGGPVLLTRGFTASAEALESLRMLQPSAVTIVGGTWSAASLQQIRQASGKEPDVRKGPDRYATSAAVAQKFWQAPSKSIIFATGATYADAMAMVPASRAYDAPILLMRKDCRPKSVLAAASAQANILVAGGTGAIADGAVHKTCNVLPAVVSQSGGFYRFNMTHQSQANGFYCGPATAQMILSRLGYNRSQSGVALSQSNLATDAYLMTNSWGRTPWVKAAMSRGLNAWMGGSAYVQKGAPSTATFRSAVSNSFTKTGRPVVVDTQEWSGGAHYNGHPSYTTFSHLMPIEGYNASTDTLIALDPASHFYAASRPSFSHNLGSFTGFLQKYGIYY